MPARQRERSSAPSPYTPFQSRGSSTTARDQTPTERSVTPGAASRREGSVDQDRSTSSTPPRRREPASPTLSAASSTTHTETQSPAKRSSSTILPTQEELRSKARGVVEKSRIMVDPSLESAFRKDLDRELWELFVGP
ncbi:hypothetical protein JCM16303_001184 [Sporobolomyces ruberrimus]